MPGTVFGVGNRGRNKVMFAPKRLLSDSRDRPKPKQTETQTQTMTKESGKTEPRGRLHPPWWASQSLWKDDLELAGQDFKFSIHLFHRSVWKCEQAGPFGHLRRCLWPCQVAPSSLSRTVNKSRAFAMGSQTFCKPGYHFIFIFLILRNFTI